MSRRSRAPRSSPSAAWPSGTARSSPRACPRPTPCSASTPTRTSPNASATSSAATPRPRTSRSTGGRCCRSRRSQRPAAVADVAVPGHAWVPDLSRVRLSDKPYAPLKLASGCDRRCAFCAIPSFRGSFVSRPPHDVLSEAAWLAEQGVRELVLVSENSTSYGKDLPGGTRALVGLLPALAAVPGLDRVRVSYLQPAEVRPDLLTTIATTPGVAPYFDLSFQHSSPAVLRRMRRFGSTAQFLDLCDRIRALAPEAGIRSNVIVGLPRRDRRRRRRAGGVPHRCAAGRRRGFRLLGRGRHRGGGLRRQGAGRGGRGPGVAHRGARRRADGPAGRGPRRHRGRRCWSSRPRTTTSSAPAGPSTRPRRWTASACSSADPGLEPGELVRCVVTGTEGADLQVAPREVLPRRAARAGRSGCAVTAAWRGRAVTPPAAGAPPLLNIANVLTGLRLMLVPVFLAALFVDDGPERAVAAGGVRGVRGRRVHRPARRPARPPRAAWSPRSAPSPTRSRTRRSRARRSSGCPCWGWCRGGPPC